MSTTLSNQEIKLSQVHIEEQGPFYKPCWFELGSTWFDLAEVLG